MLHKLLNGLGMDQMALLGPCFIFLHWEKENPEQHCCRSSGPEDGPVGFDFGSPAPPLSGCWGAVLWQEGWVR